MSRDAPEMHALRELDPERVGWDALCETYGGKSAGLGRLIAMGARVPRGFAVEASRTHPAEWPEEARRAFLRRVDDLLRGGPVIVRSSAVGEDSAALSFAGLFESELWVSTSLQALQAGERCVASGRGERVLAYLRNAPGEMAVGNAAVRELAEGLGVPMGLVVQRQVAAASAGVCFTVDPAGRDAAIVIEAVPGLGEALVSGHAQPERWRVYRSGLGILEAHQVREPTGEQALTPELAKTIAGEAEALAARFGTALDLEFAVDAAGKCWWLQGRPVTAVPPVPDLTVERSGTGDDGPISVWSNFNVGETMPDPLTPLSWAMWRDVVAPEFSAAAFGVPTDNPLNRELGLIDKVNGRVHWNLNALCRLLPRRVLPLAMGDIDARHARAVERLVAGKLLLPRQPSQRLGPWSRRNAFRWMVASLWILRPRRSWWAIRALAHAPAAALPPARQRDKQLLDGARSLFGDLPLPVRELLCVTAASAALYRVCRELVGDATPSAQEASRLLVAGLPDNPTTRISAGVGELVELGQPLADDLLADDWRARLEATSAGRDWLAALERLLRIAGQRCPGEFELAAVRWRDDPTLLVELVRAGLRSGDEPAHRRLARLADERRRALARAIADAPLWKRLILPRLLRWLEVVAPMREAPKHYLMYRFAYVRDCARELGRRLAARGVFDEGDDVFWLDYDELAEEVARPKAPGDRRSLIAERKARHAEWAAREPEGLLRSDGVPIEEPRAAGAEEAPEGARLGEPVSPGRATGRVVVMSKPDGTAVGSDVVLVVRHADPGWTPLFGSVAGVVMEIGGMMCHAAVVARELGVPAVFGVPGATREWPEGTRIEVDGTTGIVRALDEAEPAAR